MMEGNATSFFKVDRLNWLLGKDSEAAPGRCPPRWRMSVKGERPNPESLQRRLIRLGRKNSTVWLGERIEYQEPAYN